MCVFGKCKAKKCSYVTLFSEGSICSCFGSVPPVEHLTPDDQDVLEEETLVKKQAMDGTVDPNIAVQIHGLAKMYPGTTKLGCCKCTKTSPFHAVKVINQSCCVCSKASRLFNKS